MHDSDVSDVNELVKEKFVTGEDHGRGLKDSVFNHLHHPTIIFIAAGGRFWLLV